MPAVETIIHANGPSSIAAAAVGVYTFADPVVDAQVHNFDSSPATLRIVWNPSEASLVPSATFCTQEIPSNTAVALGTGKLCSGVAIYAVGAEVTYGTHFSASGRR